MVGQNTQKPEATRTFIAYSSHTFTLPANASRATARMTSARTESSSMTSRRRSSRSIMTPVNGSSKIAGTVWTTASVPRAISECVACRRSEEHTSELQSQFHLVCRLLLEKKKKKKKRVKQISTSLRSSYHVHHL